MTIWNVFLQIPNYKGNYVDEFIGGFSTQLLAENYCTEKNRGLLNKLYFYDECEIDSLIKGYYYE